MFRASRQWRYDPTGRTTAFLPEHIDLVSSRVGNVYVAVRLIDSHICRPCELTKCKRRLVADRRLGGPYLKNKRTEDGYRYNGQPARGVHGLLLVVEWRRPAAPVLCAFVRPLVACLVVTLEHPATVTRGVLARCLPFCPTKMMGIMRGLAHRLPLAAKAECGPSGSRTSKLESGASGALAIVVVVIPFLMLIELTTSNRRPSPCSTRSASGNAAPPCETR